MELFNYYSIDECKDRSRVFGTLDSLKDDGKLEYHKQGIDIIKIEDIDLEEGDIEKLTSLFDSEDVFPYMENEDDGNQDDASYDEDDYDGYYGEGY